MGKELIRIKKCRICGSTDLFDVIDLGRQPIPNGFLKKEQLKKVEKKYPLAVTFCNNCSLMQLKYLVDPKIMFKNYLYIPSSSKTRMDHFKNLAEQVKEKANLKNDSLVIDIGSNDGSLLVCFKNLGTKILGIDPAENLVKVAALSGVETVKGYFNSALAMRVSRKHGKAKAMLATNVIAHIQNLDEVLKGASILMHDEGVFVMQFPYLLDLIQKNLFDTIYHEHLSYFSVKSLKILAEKSDLEIFDIEKNDLDGGAIRVFWKKRNNKRLKINEKGINQILKAEEKYGLYKKGTYIKFSKRIEKLREESVKKIKSLKRSGKHIIGYGAAAKANVLLNYFGLNSKTIDYLVDSTHYKQGLFTPGSHIPIYSEDKIYETNPDYVLIFAWNFSKEIIGKNKKFQSRGGRFILVEPGYKII